MSLARSEGNDDDDDDEEESEKTQKKRIEEEGVYRMRFKNGESLSYYVALIYADDPTTSDKSKLPTIIDISKNPLKDVDEQNQGVTKHRFAGKSSGAICKIQQILGPFDTIDKAITIQEEWKNKARGLFGRGAHGRELHKNQKIPLWDAHCDIDYNSKRVFKRDNKRKRTDAEN